MHLPGVAKRASQGSSDAEIGWREGGFEVHRNGPRLTLHSPANSPGSAQAGF